MRHCNDEPTGTVSVTAKGHTISGLEADGRTRAARMFGSHVYASEMILAEPYRAFPVDHADESKGLRADMFFTRASSRGGRCYPGACCCERYCCTECGSHPLKSDRTDHTAYHHSLGEHGMCEHACRCGGCGWGR